MKRVAAFLIVGVTSAAVFVGCGGTSTSNHDFAAVSSCVTDGAAAAGLENAPDGLDLIAEKAGEGAVALKGDAQEVQVVVERSSGDADKTADGYRAFGANDDNLIVNGNVVVAFTKTPTDEERALVEDCL